jgi:hypothetical protein
VSGNYFDESFTILKVIGVFAGAGDVDDQALAGLLAEF